MLDFHTRGGVNYGSEYLQIFFFNFALIEQYWMSLVVLLRKFGGLCCILELGIDKQGQAGNMNTKLRVNGDKGGKYVNF